MADEDATVEVEDEGYATEGGAETPIMTNQNPNFLMNAYINGMNTAMIRNLSGF